MPVLITGGHRWLARRLALRLVAEGGEVRVYGAEDAAALRAAGVLVASGTPDDEGRLDAALTDVHTLVHVGPGLLAPDPAQIRAEAEVAARAATSAGVRRVITLSVPQPEASSDDPLRRAKAAEEAALAAVPAPTVVVRASLLDTAALRDALASAGLAAEELDVEVAPLRAEDLVELVVAFDRARSRADDGTLLVAADGPERLTLGAYLDRVGVRVAGRIPLLGRRVLDEDRAARLRTALTGGPWVAPPGPVLDGWSFAEHAPGSITPSTRSADR